MAVAREPLAGWEIEILRQLAVEKPNNVGMTGPQLLEILSRLEQAEQAVQRVREELGYIPEYYSARIRRALDGDTLRCLECNGTGNVQVQFNHGIQTQDCAVCFGTGDGRG